MRYVDRRASRELLGLQWKHIDFAAQTLAIRQALWEGELVKPKTEGSVRVIYFGPSLLAALVTQKQNSNHNGPDGSARNFKHPRDLQEAKAKLWSGIFVLLSQRVREHPRRRSWRSLQIKTFGTDPLLDSNGELMHWVGRRAPTLSLELQT